MQASEEDQRVEHILLYKQAPQVDVLNNSDLGIIWVRRGRGKREGGRGKREGREGRESEGGKGGARQEDSERQELSGYHKVLLFTIMGRPL